MAFPIPSHLPRAGIPQDISSRILSKVGSASSKELTAKRASSWVAELDDSISQTKVRDHLVASLSPILKMKTLQAKIHERVQVDLPSFDRQLTSAKSVQDRLTALTHGIDELDAAVTSPNVLHLLHQIS